MDKIKALIDGIDLENGLEKIMPDLQGLLDSLVPIMEWAVQVGPIVLLFFGLIYLLIPPKEANHYMGFRTYFGMGSIEAWRFTQRIAGIVTTLLGLVLLLVMRSTAKGFAEMDAYDMMMKAGKCLIWQAVLVLISYICISITAAVFFNRNGERRFGKK